MRAFGQDPSAGRASARPSSAATCGALLPFLLFQVMRNFVAALERPGWVLWLSLGGIVLNALLSWSLIFGHFGLPALGLVGGGLASSIDLDQLLAPCARLVVVLDPRSSGVSICSGAGGAPTGSAIARDGPLGSPIGLTMALRSGRVRAAAYLMG